MNFSSKKQPFVLLDNPIVAKLYNNSFVVIYADSNNFITKHENLTLEEVLKFPFLKKYQKTYIKNFFKGDLS